MQINPPKMEKFDDVSNMVSPEADRVDLFLRITSFRPT